MGVSYQIKFSNAVFLSINRTNGHAPVLPELEAACRTLFILATKALLRVDPRYCVEDICDLFS